MTGPRVLHVINNLPVGGAEKFLVLLSDAQRRSGLDVRVSSLAEPNPLATELAERGVPFIGIGRRRLNDPRLLLDTLQVVRIQRPDVVHTHLFYADTFGRLAARWAGVRAIVTTEHSTEGAPLSGRRRFAMRHTAGLADRIVAVSEPVRQAASERLGIDPRRIDVIPNGIEIEPWESAVPLSPGELGIEAGFIRVGAVGRLDDPKGYDVLIEALAKLDDPRLQLLLAGDGPRRAELQTLAERRGVGSAVHFLGFWKDVPRFLASLDVFAMPSRWEGHSMALLEAMASGRAIVGSEIPEIATVIGDAGVLVPPGEPAELAAALRRLCADPELRSRLGRRGREAVRDYSIVTSATRYAVLYDEILQQAPRRRT